MLCCFFFNDPATTEIYPLSLHDALPISPAAAGGGVRRQAPAPLLPGDRYGVHTGGAGAARLCRQLRAAAVFGRAHRPRLLGGSPPNLPPGPPRPRAAGMGPPARISRGGGLPGLAEANAR